jgi:Tol biopolymer transport system component
VDLDGANLTQLTTDTGDDQDPTAVKGTVVFVSYRAGNGNLYSIPLAGGATTTLTTTAKDEMTPALSPDGQRLAFSFMATDVTKIYTSAANGAGPAALVGSGAGVIETAPSWSPGGSVAFVSTLNGSADIFQQAPGGSATVLTGSSFADVEPSWNPDGSRLAFVSNRNGGTDLYVLTVSGGAVAQLTSGAGTRSQPAWTADGRIVYLETLGGTTQLRWLDPAQPAQVHSIDTGSGTVGHPTVNLP